MKRNFVKMAAALATATALLACSNEVALKVETESGVIKHLIYP